MRQAADRRVIEVGRQQQRLVALESDDIPLLPLEIAGIARIDLELLGNLRRERAKLRPYLGQTCEVDPGIGEELCGTTGNTVLIDRDAVALQCRRRQPQLEKALSDPGHRLHLRVETLASRRPDAADALPDRRQPLVGV